MASTPPPVSLRAHTPPTPQHGPLHDNYEPYSPRRSKRSATQSNPYGSTTSSDRLPKTHLQRATPPPTTSKRARFANTHLTSPPSSPASPVLSSLHHHKTPRKTPISRSFADIASDSDNTSRRQLPTPLSLFPTPSKTPKKRNASAMSSTARILNFQSYSPSDVMPSSRKIKKPGHGRSQSARGFDLFEPGTGGSQEQMEIFTDINARVPEHDNSDDNPFVGPRQTRSSSRQKRATNEEDMKLEQRAERNEGLIYSFRGKKVFRSFNNTDDQDDQRDGSPELDLSQRALKRQAGAAADRPLTRSSIQPRLLFPNEDEIRERETAAVEDEVDEEALTDIEAAIPAPAQHKTATPHKRKISDLSHLATPPSTKRTKRTLELGSEAAGLPVVTEEPEDAPMSPVARKAGKAKNRSPFDDWPRSKSGPIKGGKKRVASETPEPAPRSTKRTRSSAIASPA